MVVVAAAAFAAAVGLDLGILTVVVGDVAVAASSSDAVDGAAAAVASDVDAFDDAVVAAVAFDVGAFDDDAVAVVVAAVAVAMQLVAAPVVLPAPQHLP